MITTQAGKAEKPGLFSPELVYELLEGGEPIGRLSYHRKQRRAALTLGESRFAIGRHSDRRDEVIYQMLFRWLTGRDKPPPNPIELTDAGGRVLAAAERKGGRFALSRGEDRFVLRRASLTARPFQLYRVGSDQSLGSVGQAKLLTKSLHMDFGAELDPAFQAFLLVLVIDLSLTQLENASV
jgi:hypothetical protein